MGPVGGRAARPVGGVARERCHVDLRSFVGRPDVGKASVSLDGGQVDVLPEGRGELVGDGLERDDRARAHVVDAREAQAESDEHPVQVRLPQGAKVRALEGLIARDAAKHVLGTRPHGDGVDGVERAEHAARRDARQVLLEHLEDGAMAVRVAVRVEEGLHQPRHGALRRTIDILLLAEWRAIAHSNSAYVGLGCGRAETAEEALDGRSLHAPLSERHDELVAPGAQTRRQRGHRRRCLNAVA